MSSGASGLFSGQRAAESSPRKHHLLPEGSTVFRSRLFKNGSGSSSRVRARAQLAGTPPSGLRDLTLSCFQFCFKFHVRTRGLETCARTRINTQARPLLRNCAVAACEHHFSDEPPCCQRGASLKSPGQEKAKRLLPGRVSLGPRLKPSWQICGRIRTRGQVVVAPSPADTSRNPFFLFYQHDEL